MPTANTITGNGAGPMEINTRFGRQEIDPASVIQFPQGLAGFEHLHDFKLFHEDGKPSVFYLQAMEDAEIQFPVVNPDMFQVSYECTLSDEEAALLQLDDAAQIAVLVTVAQTGDKDRGLHANFLGPIILNTSKRIGLQKHLNQISGSVVIKAE